MIRKNFPIKVDNSQVKSFMLSLHNVGEIESRKEPIIPFDIKTMTILVKFVSCLTFLFSPLSWTLPFGDEPSFEKFNN